MNCKGTFHCVHLVGGCGVLFSVPRCKERVPQAPSPYGRVTLAGLQFTDEL